MRVLVSDDVNEKGVELLRERYDVDVKTNMKPEDLKKIIGEYDALVTRSQTQVTEDIIEAAINLKVIGRAGVGVDNINLPAATARGIVVVNAPDSNTVAAAEHTIGMMLGVTRHIPQAHQSIQDGKWDRKSFTGIQLQGKTVGIIGIGHVGGRVARRLQAFEMTVLAYDPYVTEEYAKNLGVELVDFETLLKNSDYITIHTPLTSETRDMINEGSIAKMKDGVRLVNCARGECFDVEAVAAGLKSGKIAGAAIDVYPNEPLTLENNPFLGMFNVVQTAHLGASTIEAQEGVAINVAYGVIDALDGKPVMNAVNMAPIPKNVAAVIQPYYPLAEGLGTIAIYLAEGPVEEVSVEYSGELADTETMHLTTALLKGLLNPILQDSVNYVNAPGLAKKRAIDVKETKTHKAGYFSTAIKVTVKTKKGSHSVVGTLFDGKEAKVVQIDEYRVDFKPEGFILLAPHVNKPNMIGQMATILGAAGININGMQVGSTSQSDTNIMAIAVADDIPNDIMLQLRGIDGILNVSLIHCEG